MVRWTLAHVAALRVDTVAVLTCLRILAFVNISAVSARFVQREAFVADAAEHAVNVFAFTKHAEVTKHLAFVDICASKHQNSELLKNSYFSFIYYQCVLTDARLLVAFIWMHKSHFAFATERSWVVETLAVFAETGIVGAFINILANVTIAAESSVTDAL